MIFTRPFTLLEDARIASHEHRLGGWLIILVFLTGCAPKHESGNPLEKQPEVSVGESAPAKEEVLYRNKIAHAFSSPNEMDSFRIYVTGQSITEGEITFEIRSQEHGIIHQEMFPAVYLLGYGYAGETDEEAANSIQGRIDDFFDKEQFSKPAIFQTDSFDADYSEEAIWEDIYSDTSAIGFYYLVGEENGRHIAYSKKLNKVVVYFSCC